MPRRKKTDQPRTRFNGFSLNPELEYDRIVGEWIDSQPNAAAAIKQLIYNLATGQGMVVAAGYPVTATTEEAEPELDVSDPRAQALLNALD